MKKLFALLVWCVIYPLNKFVDWVNTETEDESLERITREKIRNSRKCLSIHYRDK
jgi:hypothetical protein